ncbi:MAG: DNA replication/repair protein RecF [Eubacterium sp.]|jgi:DNA replication and repair protein RecF
MWIKRLELKNFRNYDQLKIAFSENVNLILGDNAQGKTNLLEAIYLSAFGKSFRASRDSELINFDSNFCTVSVFAEKAAADTSVEIRIISKGKTGSEKFIKKDKKRIGRTSLLLNNILIVIFSPEDLKLVKDEPEKRRRFLNREMCEISPSFYESVFGYRKTLLQRNAYLKEENVDQGILDIWDTQLASYGAKVIKKRENFIQRISDISAGIHGGITGGSENLKIVYDPDIEIKETEKEQEEYFYDILKLSQEADMRNGTTSSGPHRDDIDFIVNGVDMRTFGSQGQQRTCALSLKLAELSLIKSETGEDAILLLDDVMSELDAHRQEFLIDTMKDNQLFITTTDIDSAIITKIPDAAVFRVEAGQITRER